LKSVLSIAALFSVASNVALGQSGLTNSTTMRDYDSFYQMVLRLRPIGFEIAKFITSPPAQFGSVEAARTQECMIRLSATYESFSDQFSSVTKLIGLSAKMRDPDDQKLATDVLRVDLSGFLANTQPSLGMLEATTQTPKCAQDGATLAKASEIKRLFADATNMAQTLANRIGIKALGVRP
jgi:hypothetical protein